MSSWRIAVDLLVEAETPAEAQAMVERQMARLAATEQAPETGERKSRYWVGTATRAAAPPIEAAPQHPRPPGTDS